MKVCVFSDVHGNLPALEAMVAASRAEVDAYLCLGDVVNYGPWSEECVQLVVSLSYITYLEGNHERLYLDRDPLAEELPLVQAFTNHTRPGFQSLTAIAELPESMELGNYLAIHTIDGKRVYADTEITVDKNYVIGHTHHQFRITRNDHVIVNCGSVGQNRKSLRHANYVVYDTSLHSLDLRRTEYDAGPVIREMAARKYPPECLVYYQSKL